MVVVCVLCSSKTDLHHFPRDTSLRRLWMDFVKRFRPEWDGSTNKHGICRRHFSAGCFSNARQVAMGFSNRVILTKSAVPTIFVEQAVTADLFDNSFPCDGDGDGKNTDTVKFKDAATHCECPVSRQLCSTGCEQAHSCQSGMEVDSDTTVDVKATAQAEVTHDSCTVDFIETVPHESSACDDYHTLGFIDPVVDVKPEDPLDVKQEPADVTDSQDINYSVKQESVGECPIQGPSWFSVQPEVSSSMETTDSGINIPVELTGCNIQPAVVLETLNLSRFVSHPTDVNIQSSVGDSSVKVNTVADSNDITEHPHDDKQRPHLCTICEKRFATKIKLNHHKATHTDGKRCSCSQCGKHFAFYSSFVSHMNIHSGKYKCTECGKCCHSNKALIAHKRVHSGEKPFECTVCRKRFTQSTHLVRHSRIHSGEKPYKCHECDKAFSQSGHLKIHMIVHTGDKPYKCSLCDKSFIQLGHLQSHKRHVHSNTRPHDCHYCGKLFKSSRELKQHVYIHTGAKPYSCRHCSDCFTFRSQLKTHLLKSHKEGAWFTCYICEKKFSRSTDLKKHVRRHESVKPYVCSECSKSFCTASELESHFLLHTDVRLFCCGADGKYFISDINIGLKSTSRNLPVKQE